MAKKSAPKKSKTSRKIDFTGVESGGGSNVPEGSYLVKPVEATWEEGNEHDYAAFAYQVTAGKHKGKKLYDNNSTSPAALWRLKSTLEALGVEVPDDAMDVDLAAIIEEGNEVCVDVEMEEYQGKDKARIVGVYPAEDYKEGKDDDSGTEEPDWDEMDDDDLKAFAKDNDLEVDGIKKLEGKKLMKAVKAAFAAATEEEEEKPKDKKSGKGKSFKKDEDDKPSEKEVLAMDEDELKEVIEEHDLDVDLDDHKTLAKQRKAVAEALGAGDDKGDGEKYTDEQIDEMGTSELADLVKEHKLDVELSGSTKKKRRAVKAALVEEGLMEEAE